MRILKRFNFRKYRNRVLKRAAILSVLLFTTLIAFVYFTTKFDLLRMNEFIPYYVSLINNREIMSIIAIVIWSYIGSILAVIAFDIIKTIIYCIAVIIVGTYVIIWDTYQYLKDKDRYNSWNSY